MRKEGNCGVDELAMVITGVPLRRAQLLAGHADYATTEKYYAHLPPEGDDSAVRTLGL